MTHTERALRYTTFQTNALRDLLIEKGTITLDEFAATVERVQKLANEQDKRLRKSDGVRLPDESLRLIYRELDPETQWGHPLWASLIEEVLERRQEERKEAP
jgi:hypothetical protein